MKISPRHPQTFEHKTTLLTLAREKNNHHHTFDKQDTGSRRTTKRRADRSPTFDDRSALTEPSSRWIPLIPPSSPSSPHSPLTLCPPPPTLRPLSTPTLYPLYTYTMYAPVKEIRLINSFHQTILHKGWNYRWNSVSLRNHNKAEKNTIPKHFKTYEGLFIRIEKIRKTEQHKTLLFVVVMQSSRFLYVLSIRRRRFGEETDCDGFID